MGRYMIGHPGFRKAFFLAGEELSMLNAVDIVRT